MITFQFLQPDCDFRKERKYALFMLSLSAPNTISNTYLEICETESNGVDGTFADTLILCARISAQSQYR